MKKLEGILSKIFLLLVIEMSNPEPETYTVVSNNQRVKFFVEKHHDQLKNANNSAQSNDAQLPSNSVDKLTSLFQNSNSNGKYKPLLFSFEQNVSNFTTNIVALNL